MGKIRKIAKSRGHEVLGKLTHRPEWEYTMNPYTGERLHSGCRHYSDEGGNEYIIGVRGDVVIVNANDEVI